MTLHTKQAGAWSTVQSLYVKQSGVWVPVQNAYVKNAGAWVEYYSSEVVVTIAANTTNVNISSLFTPTVWTSSTNKRVVINSGVTVGSTTPGTPAMRTGVGWGGGLSLDNAGTIQGAGGAANSGAGGHALYADTTGCIVRNTGIIRSGGGGGGRGGNGGGGQYDYTTTEGPAYSLSGTRYYWSVSNPGNLGNIYWAGSNGSTGGTNGAGSDSPKVFGSYTYYMGPVQETVSGTAYSSVSRTYQSTAYTGGGAGGNGGRGQGHDGSNAAGSAGSAGGTNAGTGGTGGTGGAYGANGGTGNSGGSGNNGSGSSGTTGGLAGISYNAANISMTNTGTITGRTS